MQIHEISLAKKNLITEDRTYLLWESVGRRLVEAQLTAQQIQQIFQQAEQGATASGTNRTLIGKGKDAATAVNQAWEQLKTKVQNSGPIKNVDAMYDQAAEKLKQVTGGDQGVMQYVQKYRDFAKKHPIAQSLIYSALIAAAGVSGAGAGGAAALGLLKMTDRLLQGEKFSSAAYSGAKTGAVAYGASLLNDLLAGRAGVTTSVDDPEWDRLKFQGDLVSGKEIVTTTNGNSTLDSMIQSIVGPNKKGEYLVTIVHNHDLQQFVTKTPPPSIADESLKESQIRKIFYVAAGLQTQLNEGAWDSIKGAAGKAAGAVANKAQSVGHNLTTKVTADKLTKAWKAAGSPTDSEVVKTLMKQAGVSPDVINSTLGKIVPQTTQATATTKAVAPKTKATAGKTPSATNTQQPSTPPQQSQNALAAADAAELQKRRMRAAQIPGAGPITQAFGNYIAQKIGPRGLPSQKAGPMPTQPATATPPAAKPHTGGKVAGQLSRTPNAIRQRQARAANKAPVAPATQPAAGGAGAFGQMAQQLSKTTAPASTTTATGTTTTTPTGLIHTPSTTNPNLPKTPATVAPATPATPTKAPVATGTEPISIGGQKLNPKNPKDAQLISKLQGKLQEEYKNFQIGRAR